MKTKHLLTMLLLALMPLAASAYDFELNGIYYEKTGEGEVSVVKGDKAYEGAVVIPSSIKVGGVTYAVTGIGDEAFRMCTLESVFVPEGVKRIGAYGLAAWCADINLPSTLEEIGEWGLAGTPLKVLCLPEGLRVIGRNAFEGSSLTEVTIPSTVSEIGPSPFSCAGWDPATNRVNGIDRIKVAEGNIIYDSREDCNAIIETATGKLIQGSNTTLIPSGVKSIADAAFLMCQRMETLVLPAEITEYGRDCFMLCLGLKDVYAYNPKPVEAIFLFGNAVMDGFDFDHVILHVPIGSKDAYSQVNCWKQFKHIEEFDPENEASPTGIGAAETGMTGVEACFSADGKRQQAPVRGLNIVRMGDGTTKKVVIK